MPNPSDRTRDLSAALPHDVAQDLVHARLNDPFQYLGLRPHPDGFALNVFVPDADACLCLTGQKTRKEMVPVPFAPGL
ncbi:MAG: 1,4-alpha-glucan branching enzyme, partial [Celeribacter sp.]